MDKKIYENTRYQNIYRHKKNKNYVIMISKPVKSSISRIDGKKIMKLEDAINIRDNPKIKTQKVIEASSKDDFSTMWNKYIYDCKNVKKLAYNSLKKKTRLYEKNIKDSFNKRTSKINKEDIILFINNLKTSTKQKNEIIKQLKAFFNWCLEEDYIITSPIKNINYYKTEKKEMKYLIPEEIKKLFNTINEDIKNEINIEKAYRTKIFLTIEISLGDRPGETRALTFNSFSEKLGTVEIAHSINYDPNDENFVSNTKNNQSQRDIDISNKLICEVKEYKKFLIENTEYDVSDDNLIFFNYKNNKPYSDTTLRKDFYYYCDKAKINRIRIYDLRHTYVALMMGEGKELYHISTRIGHSSYSTTVNKYGHLERKKRKEIAEITDKYI